MERKKDQDTILDRHNMAIAEILRRFLNMVTAATASIPKDGALEHAALNNMTMETETTALIAEIQKLLQITREIKALWIKGPPRKPGEDASRDAEIDGKAQVVQDLYNKVMAFREQQLRSGKVSAQVTASSGNNGTESAEFVA
ncbi:hypothetical protein BX600DRAFT_455326 [Xylariales sp. PMI_506]|nr:hypothetical protein BX600DRAFT_455326 [Xylariales sp. PMI_506]